VARICLSVFILSNFNHLPILQQRNQPNAATEITKCSEEISWTFSLLKAILFYSEAKQASELTNEQASDLAKQSRK